MCNEKNDQLMLLCGYDGRVSQRSQIHSQSEMDNDLGWPFSPTELELCQVGNSVCPGSEGAVSCVEGLANTAHGRDAKESDSLHILDAATWPAGTADDPFHEDWPHWAGAGEM